MEKIDEETKFDSPLEQDLYLEALGATKTSLKSEGMPVYQYKDLLFSTNREYQSIYCESSIYGKKVFENDGESLVIDKTLEDFLGNGQHSMGSGISFYGNNIFDVEGLVYAISKIYHSDNLEKFYYETLEKVKTQVILNSLNDFDKSGIISQDSTGYFSPFISAFLRVLNMNEEEDVKKFLQNFVVNTTGVYTKGDKSNLIRLIFKNKGKLFQFEVLGDEYSFNIRNGEKYSIYYRVIDGEVYLSCATDKIVFTWNVGKDLIFNEYDITNANWQKIDDKMKEYILEIVERVNRDASVIDSAFDKEGKTK